MGVDEAGNDDAVGRIDHRAASPETAMFGPDLADLAVLDQHVGLGEVADLPVERQHDAALDEDAALRLQPGQLGIAAALGADRRVSIGAAAPAAASAAPAVRKPRREVASARKPLPSSQHAHRQRRSGLLRGDSVMTLLPTWTRALPGARVMVNPCVGGGKCQRMSRRRGTGSTPTRAPASAYDGNRRRFSFIGATRTPARH